MYTKSLERWNVKAITNRKTWAAFRQNMIAEFENINTSGAGPSLGQEGYGGAYNMTEATDNGDSMAESIVQYSEHATATNRKVIKLENRLSRLGIGGLSMLVPQQQQMVYYIPEAAYITPAPSTIPLPPPQTLQSPQPPQQ